MTDDFVPSGGGDAEPSTSLLVRVRAGDAAAWQRLVSLYAPLVYRRCRRMGLQAADATDVGQEVFVAVARSIDAFRREQPTDSFRRWLRTITRNKVMDHYRHRAGREAGAGGSEARLWLEQLADDGRAGEETDADRDDRRLLYRRAIELVRGEFEERTWRAFLRAVVDGQAAGDVADELGMTRNAAYLAKARVLRRLRQEFDDLGDL
jgi:RNA polymerase sigma-70 factor (ECF subfamily)